MAHRYYIRVRKNPAKGKDITSGELIREIAPPGGYATKKQALSEAGAIPVAPGYVLLVEGKARKGTGPKRAAAALSNPSSRRNSPAAEHARLADAYASALKSQATTARKILDDWKKYNAEIGEHQRLVALSAYEGLAELRGLLTAELGAHTPTTRLKEKVREARTAAKAAEGRLWRVIGDLKPNPGKSRGAAQSDWKRGAKYRVYSPTPPGYFEGAQTRRQAAVMSNPGGPIHLSDEGGLYGWHTDQAAATRRRYLTTAVNSEDYATIVRRLNAIRTLGKNTWRKSDLAKVTADLTWLRKKYR